MLEKLLHNILDVPGTDGVCVMDLQGNLRANRFPALFPEEVFRDLGRRVSLLLESVDDNFVPTDDLLLRFEGKIIFIRRNEQAVLVILADEKINFMLLKMVTNLALKHLTTSLLQQLHPEPSQVVAPDARPAAPVAAPAPETPAPAVSASPPPAPPPRPRFYRGQAF